MKIIDQLVKKENFTNIEIEISNYILKHKDDIVLSSIQQVAGETYSSNAAIIRLTKKLGCSGFKDFKIQLLKELESKRDNLTFIDYNYPFHDQQSTQSVASQIGLLYKNTVDHIYSNLSIKELNACAKYLLNAETIYYYGTGDSRLVGMGFENKLNKIGKKIFNAEMLGDSTTFTTMATSKDVALVISYRGVNDNYIKTCELLNKNKVPVLVLTANKQSQLLKYAKGKLIIPKEENSESTIATFYSTIAFNYVLDIVYSLVYGLQYTYSTTNRLKVIKNQK